MQAAHFAKLIAESNGSSVVVQVDFSENATLVQQNEIQYAHCTHKQVTIFTAPAWINQGIKESFFHSWRGFLTPHILRKPPYIAYPLFSNFDHPPRHTHTHTYTHTHTHTHTN